MGKNLNKNFTFGALAAEDDNLLPSAFHDNGDFTSVENREDARCFIIGRTGCGKSAILRHLKEVHPERVITVSPESLSLRYIVNLPIMKRLQEADVKLDLFLKALWKHVIIVEIIRHHYKIASEPAKLSVFEHLRKKFTKESNKRALSYLDEFGDKFWCETEVRVKQIFDKLEDKVKGVGELNAFIPGITTKGTAETEHIKTQEITQEVKALYQRVVNDPQLSYLNDMVGILDEVLEPKQKFCYLLIDDLDKEWVDDDLAVSLIRYLFDAVLDLQKVRGLKILVALRTNIFQQLKYGERKRGTQEEKIQGLALNIKWTESDLFNLLETRTKAAYTFYKLDPPSSLADILPAERKPPIAKVDRAPSSYIFNRTLLRPRDAISYLNKCATAASGQDVITWENIIQVEREYSVERLAALRDEWRDPYLGIDKSLKFFDGAPLKILHNDLGKILDRVAELSMEDNIRDWLGPMFQNFWDLDNEPANWHKRYGQFISLLYEISFLGIAKNEKTSPIYSYQDPLLAGQLDKLNSTSYFTVHTAFRSALDIKN